MKKVHDQDMLFVAPCAEGWCVVWLLVEGNEHGARLGPETGENDEDEDDDHEHVAACGAVAGLAGGVSVYGEEAGDPWEFYFFLSEGAAKVAAEAATRAVTKIRRSPAWAKNALAAGWSPPPDWSDVP
jgi:hypothetical protein